MSTKNNQSLNNIRDTPSTEMPFMPENYSVLLAVSDQNVLTPAESALRKAGFKAVVCRNGFDALIQCIDAPPTMLAINELLDGIDGLSLIRLLYAIPRFRRTPFIFFPRKAGEYPMWATKREIFGAVCFLSVPFHEEEFRRMAIRCAQGIHDGEFPRPERDFEFIDTN